ncbi:MAG: hypothetical protein JKY25_11555 [Robiginitomaculum sp.]|nr:hypothetical protein [Robiginitomaculum sp.]
MTKQTLTINSIDLIPIKTDPGPELYADPYSGFYIDGELLVKRINALIKYSSDLESEMVADKHAREISILMKTVKEILTHNKAIVDAEISAKQTYTLEEKEALATELAELISKNGGLV